MSDKERTEKFTKIAVVVVSGIITLLFALAFLSGCKQNNIHPTWESMSWSPDTVDHKCTWSSKDSIKYYPWTPPSPNYNPVDAVMDSVEMDCGE